MFAGGWTLDSANFVCADDSNDVLDLLAQLVNKSLVVVERQPNTEVRYNMLETIREFAREKLRGAGEIEGLRARHFDCFLRMVQQGEPNLFAPESSIDWAEAEIDNLRAALTWALDAETDRDSADERTGRALELIAHVWPLWLYRGYSMEGDGWLNQLLSVHTAATPARARALLLAGDLARYRGDYAGGATFFQESLALARELDDKKRIAWALMEMGEVERDLHHYSQAILLLTESVEMFQQLNDHLWDCRISFELAETHIIDRDLETAKPLLQHGLALCRAENDKWQMAWGLEALGNLKRLEGYLEQARQLYTESLNLRVSVMDKAGITRALEAFAELAAAQKQFERAAALWGAAEQLRQTLTMLRLPSEQKLYSSQIPEARAQLGEEIFSIAWAKGQAMNMQQAIEYALTLPSQ